MIAETMISIRLENFISGFSVVFALMVLAAASEHKTYLYKGIECDLCPPGSHWKDHCTATQRTTCTVCPRGTYVHKPNKLPKCLQCKNGCHITHQQVVRNCTTMINTICLCKDGYWLRSEHDPHCMRHRNCLPGYGVVIPGTPFSNTRCEKCQLGTFSDEYSKTQKCELHTKCKKYLFHGNDTHDSKCANASHPSSSKGSTTIPENVSDGIDIKVSTTVPARNDTTRKDTKGNNVNGAGNTDAILIAVFTTIAFCFLCWLFWKFGYPRLLKLYKNGDGNNNGGPENKDSNGNAMELPAAGFRDGAGDTSGPGTSTGGAGDTSGPGTSTGGDRAVPAAPGLVRRVSSGLLLNKKPDYRRSSSRNSGPENDPLMAHNAVSEDDDEVFNVPPSSTENIVSSSGVSSRRPLGQGKAGERWVNHEPLKHVHVPVTRRASRRSSSNEAFVSSTDQLDADSKKTEMPLRIFLDKAADILQTDNWKKAMRTLPGLALTDGEIENIYHDNKILGIAEAKYKCLKAWHIKNADENVVKSVVEALEKVVGKTRQVKELRNVIIKDS